ncbi:MAG TPA: hypothetical protein VFV38_17280, partial [Ktedonobacteraceae bacterium]|nr:hypothetical protein [Ktedonobacteraceae bacterium]
LVDERMLRWMMAALKQETRPVNLMLVPQEASAMLLLFSLSRCTLICRSKTAPIPLVWEQRIAAPSSHALLLSRSLLVKALDFLSAGQARNTNRYISLGVSNHRLCLQWDPLAQTDHSALCQLPIVNTVADIEPVLVHLQQARRMLRQIKGPALCLERGTMMLRQKKGATVEPVPVGFVRFSLPAEETTRIMLTIVEYPAPPSADPADSSESREKGETLAHVSSSSNPL